MWPTPRAGPRVDVHLEVRYHSAQGFVAAYATKLNGGGLFIATPTPLAVNQDVLLQFRLPGVAEPLELQGLVVCSNPFASQTAFPTGMGIKFLGLEPELRTILEDFVRRTLAEAHGGSSAPAGPAGRRAARTA